MLQFMELQISDMTWLLKNNNSGHMPQEGRFPEPSVSRTDCVPSSCCRPFLCSVGRAGDLPRPDCPRPPKLSTSVGAQRSLLPMAVSVFDLLQKK